MDVKLNAEEARVLGCLIEKQLSTPEYYPLSLNALTNACNQKNNRDPVTQLTEQAVARVANHLTERQLVRRQQVKGSRVEKYSHTLSERLTNVMNFSKKELAVLAELLLRGPQTPGELRARTERMYKFADIDELTAVLDQLGKREDGPYVVELERQPGRRENRFAQLFYESEESPAARLAPAAASISDTHTSDLESRVLALEQTVAELQAEIARLHDRD